MTIKNLRFSFILLALCAFAGTAAAQAVDTPSTSSGLAMSALVETTLQLNIGGTAVTGTDGSGVFAMDFGSVNALGLGTPTTGITVTTNATGALYQSAITLTPIFTGFGSGTADLNVKAGTDDDQDIAREGESLSAVDSGGSAPTTTAGADFASNVANGAPTSRAVGFFIAKTEVAGAKVATLIYSVTVE
jgi:hypothetical protein